MFRALGQRTVNKRYVDERPQWDERIAQHIGYAERFHDNAAQFLVDWRVRVCLIMLLVPDLLHRHEA